MSLVGRDEAAPPRVIGGRTFGRRAWRRAGIRRGGANGAHARRVGWNGSRHGGAYRLVLAVRATTPSLLLTIPPRLAKGRVNQGPRLAPAVRTRARAQGDQRIDMIRRPMHPRPFEPGFDHQFVAALDHAAPDRIARRL